MEVLHTARVRIKKGIALCMTTTGMDADPALGAASMAWRMAACMVVDMAGAITRRVNIQTLDLLYKGTMTMTICGDTRDVLLALSQDTRHKTYY